MQETVQGIRIVKAFTLEDDDARARLDGNVADVEQRGRTSGRGSPTARAR